MTNDEDEILYYNDQYVHFATFKFQKSAVQVKPTVAYLEIAYE